MWGSVVFLEATVSDVTVSLLQTKDMVALYRIAYTTYTRLYAAMQEINKFTARLNSYLFIYNCQFKVLLPQHSTKFIYPPGAAAWPERRLSFLPFLGPACAQEGQCRGC